MMRVPFVSVIIVNYNGAHYLPACLDGLQIQSYPQDCFEVIVSDNASSDDSLGLMQSKYSWVRVLANGQNFGFALGNNVAMRVARGEYLVLLNNDTAPSPNWLENLVAVAEKDPTAGMVTGRLQLFYDQIVLTLESTAVDSQATSIRVFQVDSGTPGGVVQYLDGFEGWERSASGRLFRQAKDKALLGVPVPLGAEEWALRLCLSAQPSDDKGVRVRVMAQDTRCAELMVFSEEPAEYEMTIPAATRAQATPLVQNAGSIIFRNGAGRDRGTFVRNAEAFYEVDRDQYNSVEEVFAGCGANLLIRKTMLEDVGFFDDDFFTYYEDADLAWRARLRGWKVLYAPYAIVRHIHCGTSKEWSPLFLYYTQRNRLAMLLKNARWSQAFWEWGKYAAGTANSALKALLALARRQTNWRMHVQGGLIQARVLGTLLRWLPSLCRKRRWIQRARRVSDDAIEPWFVS